MLVWTRIRRAWPAVYLKVYPYRWMAAVALLAVALAVGPTGSDTGWPPTQ